MECGDGSPAPRVRALGAVADLVSASVLPRRQSRRGLRAPYALAGLISMAALASAGCWGSDPSGSGVPTDRVAAIGEQALTEAHFDDYLRREVGVPVAEIDDAARDRLYEEFLTEVLFARAAERIGLVPTEEQTRRMARRLAPDRDGEPDARLLTEARQVLMARAYIDQVLVPAIAVDPEEVERRLGSPEKRLVRDHVVFRQILSEDKKSAEEAYRRITRQGESFESVAREASAAADAGSLQQRSLASLPEEVAELLRSLREGTTSRPLELDGGFYLFQVDARNRDPDPGREREREQMRLQVFQEKLNRLKESRLVELAAEEGVRAPRLTEGAKESK